MPQIYLMYSPQSKPTGRELAEELGVEHGSEDPGERVDYLIRWGTRKRIQYIPSEQTLNTLEASRLAMNKYKALERMDSIGVRVPEHSRHPSDVDYPFLARDERHSGGTDIRLILQSKDLARGRAHHYVKYVPTRKEHRVHVFDGDIVKVSEKRFTGDRDDYVPWIRNADSGYTFHNTDTPMRYFLPAVTAVRGLGLDFGAVDVVHGEDGYRYVLEVNTAPSLCENSLEVYVEQFKNKLNI